MFLLIEIDRMYAAGRGGKIDYLSIIPFGTLDEAVAKLAARKAANPALCYAIVSGELIEFKNQILEGIQ